VVLIIITIAILFTDADAKNVMYVGSALPRAIAIKPQTINNQHLEVNSHTQVIKLVVMVYLYIYLLVYIAKKLRRL